MLDESVSAPVEILLLLNNADGNRLQKDVLRALAKNNTQKAVERCNFTPDDNQRDPRHNHARENWH